MNTASKILTLCVVILVLVGSVLMYMRHVSQPPVSMEYYTVALLDLDSLGQNGWDESSLEATNRKLEAIIDRTSKIASLTKAKNSIALDIALASTTSEP